MGFSLKQFMTILSFVVVPETLCSSIHGNFEADMNTSCVVELSKLFCVQGITPLNNASKKGGLQ